MPRPPLTPGLYRHFKGGLYEVVGTAEVVDTPELLVIYRPLYGSGELVARRYDEFTGTLERDGVVHQRFVLVEARAVLPEAITDESNRPTRR